MTAIVRTAPIPRIYLYLRARRCGQADNRRKSSCPCPLHLIIPRNRVFYENFVVMREAARDSNTAVALSGWHYESLHGR